MSQTETVQIPQSVEQQIEPKAREVLRKNYEGDLRNSDKIQYVIRAAALDIYENNAEALRGDKAECLESLYRALVFKMHRLHEITQRSLFELNSQIIAQMRSEYNRQKS